MSACSKSLHGISSTLICTTDSTVLQPPITLLTHAHYHHRFAKFALQPWSAPQTNVLWMRQATSVAHFEWRHSDRHWPIKDHHFLRVTFVTRMESFTEHFIRVWIHTCMNSYAYKSNAFEKIHVCKIPCMILHYDTRIKNYTYEKSHVWKVTRLKNYTQE